MVKRDGGCQIPRRWTVGRNDAGKVTTDRDFCVRVAPAE